MTAPPAGTSPPPSRDDDVTMRTCPACGQRFAPSGRRRWCSPACKQAAWRRRRPPAPEPPVPPKGRRRAMTVYECPACGEGALGDQRCPDCGTFMPAAGIGGLCPCCDEPVTIAELIAGAYRLTDRRCHHRRTPGGRHPL